MDKKTLIAVAASAVVTLLATTTVGWVLGVFQRGSTALTEDQIKAVMEDVMVLDDGDSYGKALSEIRTEQAVMKSTLEALIE